MTLRTKGILVLLALFAYASIAAMVIAPNRNEELSVVSELERTHRVQEVLIQANIAVARAILTVNENYIAPEPAVVVPAISMEIDAVQSSLSNLPAQFPELAPSIARLDASRTELRAKPSRGGIAVLRSTLHSLVVSLDTITRDVRARKEMLLTEYHEAEDRVVHTTIFFGLTGLVVLGIGMVRFFTRLAADIRGVAARAVAIVHGYRGSLMAVSRKDEVGGLMDALNRMQHELREREVQLELSRQQHFHKEKMAAVGSLAAQLAHEINNPIAAIAGIAEAIGDVRRSEGRAVLCSNCQPDLILEQARRVASITRQISLVSAPQSTEPQLLDLNGLVRNTCEFIRYDSRFKRVDLRLELDPQLPALTGVADHLTQVLMNLLINSADATEGMNGTRPLVTVTTRMVREAVQLGVADNGQGMSHEVRNRAFEEFFTTKPAGKGSGLGLALCKNLIEASGGSIAIHSQVGVGTSVTIDLPLANQEEVIED
jgi:two-component system, NtrC family, sensor kinase